jgi:hypothetical protein
MKSTLRSSAIRVYGVARDPRLLLLIAGAGAVIAAACSGGATGPVFPTPTSVAGSWHFTANFNDSASINFGHTPSSSEVTHCTVAGNASITQTGDTFSGQMTGTTRTCTGPGASTASWDGAITEGQVVGHTVLFRTVIVACDWAGNDSVTVGSIVGHTGATGCFLTVGTGHHYFLGGTMQMTR